MYNPEYARVTDSERLFGYVDQNPFGTLITYSDAIRATHLPMLIGKDGAGIFLQGHMARANEQWKGVDGTQALALFLGPDAYVSPRWLKTEHPVPTWNYVTVQARGILHVLEKEKRNEMVMNLVRKMEGDGEFLERVREKHYQIMLEATLGFEIRVTSLEGKWKLSQNHTPESRKSIIENLMKSSDAGNSRIANLMEEVLST
ncbi:MAG: FMN-binding negative transcriptional regulator [Candidatus Thermoplasmatota archaeon]|nr:FMN-binding negative transcriptional regulator [Candidatus Thermoplasmatota archaeon]